MERKLYAFSTLPCEGWTAEQQVDICVKLGFRGIELREGPGFLVTLDMAEAEAARITGLFEAADIRITNIGSSICVKGTETDGRLLEQFLAAAKLARVMKAGGIRVFLGNFARRRDNPLAPLDEEGIVRWLQEASRVASAHNTEVWIETHNEYATGEVLARLLDRVNHPACKVIYDIIHPIEDGEVPAQTVKLLGDRCAHVHMKDGIPPGDPMVHDWIYTPMGEGDLPIREVVSLLRESGYQGFYSLEWESKWRAELQKPGMGPDVVFPHYIGFMDEILR
ncbi:MAG: hypothetical protein K0R57_1899 [Paenibacillaceae bacterium]|nr:hypothetical protein [Paenibacillaceae bacterium]